ETLGVFRQLRAEHDMSILLVEHNMRAVMNICDRIYVLHHGEIICSGTPDEVTASETVLRAYLWDAHDLGTFSDGAGPVSQLRNRTRHHGCEPGGERRDHREPDRGQWRRKIHFDQSNYRLGENFQR